jgi:hypothetical protein
VRVPSRARRLKGEDTDQEPVYDGLHRGARSSNDLSILAGMLAGKQNKTGRAPFSSDIPNRPFG